MPISTDSTPDLLRTASLVEPPLPPDFYDRDVVQVARELVGKRLVRHSRDGIVAGRIVETEAYLAADDPACHAARGRTRKNASMFGPPGRAYVYSIHARWCLNTVTQPRGVPSAVLIRAVQPLLGIGRMQRRRNTERTIDLARGPSRLCQAFQIDRRLDGWDLSRGERLWLTLDPDFPIPHHSIGNSPRIGVTSAFDLCLRFYLRGSNYVSGPNRLRT